MPPVEGAAAARNNLFAYAPFGGHIALVVGLTSHILLVARRAAKSLPPTTSTRSQQPLRRRYAVLFSALAALSLASVTTFAVIWRAVSYARWADHSGAPTSQNALYAGGYADADGRWYLGDWILDVNLQKEQDEVAVATQEGFLYTTQHFVGLMASSIFFGVEGHRRNLSSRTIAAFVILGATGSLGYALSLFFVTILYTPLTLHKDDSPLHDALFTPSPVFYYLPIGVSLLFLYYLPDIVPRNLSPSTVDFLRWGKIAVPLLLAFAPQIVPLRLGRQHVSRSAAHRSYSKVFHFLSVASFVLYWTMVVANVSDNTPKEHHHHFWDVFKNSVELKADNSWSNRVLTGISTTGQNLKHISKHPIISVTSLDVLFTVISLFTWTFTRDLDVDAIMENSILSFFVPKHEKHVAFVDDAKPLADLQPETEPVLETTTPRKRGRPAKNKTALDGASASLAGAIRRSGRRATRTTDLDSDDESTTISQKAHSTDYESDPDAAYRPSSKTKRDVAETEADGATTAADLVHSGESTALAMFLAFAGGLGQLAASALGAEVTGPRE